MEVNTKYPFAKVAAIQFPSKKGAEKALKLFVEGDKRHMLILKDAAILVRTKKKGKLKAKTLDTMSSNYIAAGALHGTMWGAIFGLIILPLWPFFVIGGAISGAAGGAIAGMASERNAKKSDVADAVKEDLPKGHSILFVIVENVNRELFEPELRGLGGTVLPLKWKNGVDPKELQAVLDGDSTVTLLEDTDSDALYDILKTFEKEGTLSSDSSDDDSIIY
mmetsp:Transcript_19683/g.55344  ORF Transcript_19683/g.55344 Transcript_19683/m.55344 type:complete len:221 (-) Transcript_19683:112-774(-)|eukprot:CAMPEP_0119133586 /NCGR_PEP_ID=MMETSP1310-20130426/13453_1 /TAXON_ID=464262 /ORGANISM="Genus nov. species nov., Strain RCC2339" /LENGTH=220 /DNA_ID=CAMNT_0007124285 /DNA_START=199 /DNA_END=861 /DNA_ORIENTATION=-